MKRLLFIPILLMATVFQAMSQDLRDELVVIPDETLTYDIIYKWGFINKVAGYATLTLRSDGDLYKAAVYGKNAPWANSIYMLRDTLYTTMTKKGLFPVKYELIAHENGKYKKDIVDFTRSGNVFSAECTRWKRNGKDKETTKKTISLEASGMTVDMLSTFFYLRTLDFDKMEKGQGETINIFSGTKKEKLKITYKGRGTVTVGGVKHTCYQINFSFSRDGKQSSSPITGWISDDNRRIPLKVEGQLPVGKVRAIYTGANP